MVLYSELLKGLLVTLEITVLSFLGGFALGVILAVGRAYGGLLSRAISTVYIELIRGTPMLLQLYIIAFGLPIVIRQYNPNFVLNVFWGAVLGMALNSAAYQAEYLRGAFKAIESGQIEAALALGMSKWQVIRHIVLPQALRIMIPSWSNELVYLLKYSSLAMLLAVPELMYKARWIASKTFKYVEIYFIVALLYLVFALLFSYAMRLLERKLYIPGVTVIRRTTF